MARRWRLRNKLLLGLGLVVGSVAALLVGAALGLTSYMGTMKTTDSKLAELLKLDKLEPIVSTLIPREVARGEDLRQRVNGNLVHARKLFGEYKTQFEDTVARRRDPDPYQDSKLIEDIDKNFQTLQDVIDKYYSGVTVIGDHSTILADDPAVKKEYESLQRKIDELRHEVSSDMYRRIDAARHDYRRSIWIVSVSTCVATILVLTLVGLFSGWVFQPIKQLQAGVNRVSQGDFTHPIDLRSGDELEELGTAFNDMTQRLHGIYQDLERQVNDRSRQLVRSERMVSVGFLAAGVAHEINNPLASIAFCSEALQSRLGDYLRRNPQDTEVITKYLNMIQQEAFRCKKITSRLLEFSRMGERRREPVELSELIQNVLEMAQHLPHCRGKRMMFQPYSPVTAGVCAEDIKSVVLNLVVNALESMEEGGVLTITLQARGPIAEMVFSDTGCGMAPEVVQNIFEPFFTRSRTGKGTGLGLFITHHIIDQHGGDIQVASAGPGQGSTFTVRVPLQPSQVKGSDGNPDVLAFRKAPIAILKTEEGIGHAVA